MGYSGQDPDLLMQLQNMLAGGGLTQDTVTKGERLLQRLSSAVRVVLMGPEGAGKAELYRALMATPLEDTVISVSPGADEIPFGQADICVWCTSDFGTSEAMQWQNAPDRLKDHSFLVPIAGLTPALPGFTTEQLDVLGDVAAEEFHSMFPVTLGPQNKDSTLQALTTEIARLVKSGRVADRDNVAFFLTTHRPDPKAPSALTAQDPEADSPVQMVDVAMPSDLGAQVDDGASGEIYHRAFNYICDHAADLPTVVPTEDAAEISLVLSICQETSEAVAEMFSDSQATDPDFLLVKEDVLCAADKLLLMSMESGVAPAIAAVTTLLQTRREMQARIAA